METTDLNHGQLLKDWVHHLRLKPKTLLERLDYGSNYENLYYWYGRKEIKMSKLQEWAAAFKISLEQLLAGPKQYRSATGELEESEIPYRLHHGKQLEKLIEDRHTNITGLASAVKYSRQNIYDMFDRPTLDDDVLQKLAKFFNVPTTYFTGGGKTKGFFEQNENEVFDRLQVMLNNHKAETLASIELLLKKYCGKSK